MCKWDATPSYALIVVRNTQLVIIVTDNVGTCLTFNGTLNCQVDKFTAWKLNVEIRTIVISLSRQCIESILLTLCTPLFTIEISASKKCIVSNDEIGRWQKSIDTIYWALKNSNHHRRRKFYHFSHRQIAFDIIIWTIPFY